MQAGRDMQLYKPLTREGHADVDGLEVYGCHQGDFHHLNVQNPQPGRYYYYLRRTPAGIQRGTLQGWRVVGPEDPERQPLANNPNFANAGLDASLGTPEVILAYMAESDFRRRQETIHETNRRKARSADPAEDWRSKNQSLEGQYDRFRSKKGEPFYFVGRDHGLRQE